MKIETATPLAIDSVKVVKFKRFCDHRGYFTESYRKSDFQSHPAMSFMKGVEFVQCSESYSRAGTIRGLHFQWNPYMGKLVRTLSGRMIDIVLDIRKGSPTFGKAIMYDMPADLASDAQEWICVPPGFAHGNVFSQDTVIEYFCSGEYSQGCEAGISPFAPDIDWSLCDRRLKQTFDDIYSSAALVTEKDRNGLSLQQWVSDKRSNNFTIQTLA